MSPDKSLTSSSTSHQPRRIAKLMLHTSPLDQAGTGDAGGMNIYVVESARRMAASGLAVDIFTRAHDESLPRIVDLEPGVRVKHLHAHPYRGVSKSDIPALMKPLERDFFRHLEEDGGY